MANKRIKDLSDTATSMDAGDYLVVDAADDKTKKILWSDLSSGLGGGGPTIKEIEWKADGSVPDIDLVSAVDDQVWIQRQQGVYEGTGNADGGGPPYSPAFVPYDPLVPPWTGANGPTNYVILDKGHDTNNKLIAWRSASKLHMAVLLATPYYSGAQGIALGTWSVFHYGSGGSGGSGGAVQNFSGSISQGGVSTDAFKIGDLQGEDQIFISATVMWSLYALPWQVSATYGRVDASGERVLMAAVGVPAGDATVTTPSQFVVRDGFVTGAEIVGQGWYQLKPIGDEVFFEIHNNTYAPRTIDWSSMVIGAGGSGSGSGGSSLSSGETPPSTGDFWYDTINAQLYVKVDGAWVQANA